MSTIIKIIGQITLKALTDVESTTYYYLLQSSMAPAPSKPTTNPPTGGWSTTEPEFFIYTPTQDTTIVSGKDYYIRSGTEGSYVYTKVLEPSVSSLSSYYEKIYGDTRSLYVTVQTLYTDTTFEYSEPSLSSSYEAAKEAYNRAKTALDLAGDTNQYFWTLSSAYSTDIPAGVYVTHIPQSQFKLNPAQGNILMQNTGLTIRNGAVALASLTNDALNFYNPTTHNVAMQLTGQALNFYESTNNKLALSLTGQALDFYNLEEDRVSASLNNEGLNITEGSIKLGEKITDYFLSRDKGIVYPLKKVYYSREGDSESYEYVPVSVNDFFETVSETEGKNPSEEKWYVKPDEEKDEYILTLDTEPDAETTYYKLKDIVPKKAPYYELRDTHAFQVTADGYLNAQAGWIGGSESYVKLEKDEETNGHYLDVRLSQLDMLLGGDLYGQENIVDVLDIVAQQSDFIRLWTGEQVWLYYKDGEGTEPYIVYQYTDNDTGENAYYYNKNQFLEGQYFPSEDDDFLDKEYYEQFFDDIKYPTGIPKEQEYYESDGEDGYKPTSDEAVEYILSSDEEVKDDKIYYEKITKVGIETYIEIENPSGNPSAQHFYETKTYFIVDYRLVEQRGDDGPQASGYYEPYVSNWQEYVGSIDNLQVMSIAGLSQSLKFTDDSLGNQQRFIVSSANDTDEEKLKIEIDPHYLKFLVESEENPSLEMSLNYNTSSDSNSLLINSGSDNLFSVEDNTGYALSTTTGFKAGPLGMFHYKDGLVIGLI